MSARRRRPAALCIVSCASATGTEPGSCALDASASAAAANVAASIGWRQHSAASVHSRQPSASPSPVPPSRTINTCGSTRLPSRTMPWRSAAAHARRVAAREAGSTSSAARTTACTMRCVDTPPPSQSTRTSDTSSSAFSTTTWSAPARASTTDIGTLSGASRASARSRAAAASPINSRLAAHVVRTAVRCSASASRAMRSHATTTPGRYLWATSRSPGCARCATTSSMTASASASAKSSTFVLPTACNAPSSFAARPRFTRLSTRASDGVPSGPSACRRCFRSRASKSAKLRWCLLAIAPACSSASCRPANTRGPATVRSASRSTSSSTQSSVASESPRARRSTRVAPTSGERQSSRIRFCTGMPASASTSALARLVNKMCPFAHTCSGGKRPASFSACGSSALSSTISHSGPTRPIHSCTRRSASSSLPLSSPADSARRSSLVAMRRTLRIADVSLSASIHNTPREYRRPTLVRASSRATVVLPTPPIPVIA
mmetsp:Transcript_26346/g.91631  ORF Transcript_26346/g.91631 Transcript_26346/m.91631 type:complete len:494 (-) Transcript_26346:1268-2749(-)